MLASTYSGLEPCCNDSAPNWWCWTAALRLDAQVNVRHFYYVTLTLGTGTHGLKSAIQSLAKPDGGAVVIPVSLLLQV